MAVEDAPEETKVSDRRMVTIPAEIRRHLGIDASDKLRWNVIEEETLVVEIVHQRDGVFDDFEPVDAGHTNAVEIEAEYGDE